MSRLAPPPHAATKGSAHKHPHTFGGTDLRFQELTLATEAGFYLKPSELYLLGGITYRNKDAFALSLGVKKSNYIAKIAYDINSSSLTSASSGRGAFEISFTYTHNKSDRQKVKTCPRL